MISDQQGKNLARIRVIRNRHLTQVMAVAEARRKALNAAAASLSRVDQHLRELDIERERMNAWLSWGGPDSNLIDSTLARAAALDDAHVAGLRARLPAVAAVQRAQQRLDEARRAVGRAQARLSAAETMERTVLAAGLRRRERLAELEQEDRLFMSQARG